MLLTNTYHDMQRMHSKHHKQHLICLSSERRNGLINHSSASKQQGPFTRKAALRIVDGTVNFL